MRKTKPSFSSVRQRFSLNLSFFLSIVLWIVTNIISAFFSPWDNGAVLDQLLLGGAYDIWSLNKYSFSVYKENCVILFFIICAVFSYIQMLKRIFDKIPDGFAVNNLIAYISCILFYYLLPVADKIIQFYDSDNINILIKIVIFFAFAVFIFLPSLINIIRLQLYSMIASFLGTTVIQPIGTSPVFIILSVVIVFVVMSFVDAIFDVFIAEPLQEKINKIIGKIIKENPISLKFRKIISLFRRRR